MVHFTAKELLAAAEIRFGQAPCGFACEETLQFTAGTVITVWWCPSREVRQVRRKPQEILKQLLSFCNPQRSQSLQQADLSASKFGQRRMIKTQGADQELAEGISGHCGYDALVVHFEEFPHRDGGWVDAKALVPLEGVTAAASIDQIAVPPRKLWRAGLRNQMVNAELALPVREPRLATETINASKTELVS